MSQSQEDTQVKNKTSELPRAKRFTRASLSCHPCRARKAKCGCVPPEPCTNCIERSQTCTWPAVDHRSHRRRSRDSQEASGSGFTPLAVTSNESANKPLAPIYESFENLFGQDTPLGSSLSLGPGEYSLPAYACPFDYSIPLQTNPGLSEPNVLNHSEEFNDNTQWNISSILNSLMSTQEAQVGHTSSRTLPQPNKDVSCHILWRRHHGRTAFVPGVQTVNLNLHIRQTPPSPMTASPDQGGDAAGVSHSPGMTDSSPMSQRAAIMELLNVFEEKFGSYFPFIDVGALRAVAKQGSEGSEFLLCSVAAVTASFSTHPDIVKPFSEPHSYGIPFYEKAKSMIGSVLTVPLRETVMGFILLAHCAASDSLWSEIWMFTSIAVNMSYDLGLHFDPSDWPSVNTSAEERTLNKLVFWGVLMLDFVVTFGCGRPTLTRLQIITQALPTQEEAISLRKAAGNPLAPSPFPAIAELMLLGGHLFNGINLHNQTPNSHERRKSGQAAIMSLYRKLPETLQWNSENLRRHNANNQGSILLYLHAWTVGLLTLSSDLLDIDNPDAQLNHFGARTISEMVSVADAINPATYLTCPFICQPLYLAASYLRQSNAIVTGTLGSDAASSLQEGLPTSTIANTLTKTLASGQVETIQNVLARMRTHWLWVDWIIGLLKDRDGATEADLSSTNNVFPMSSVMMGVLPTKYHAQGARVN